ncbi:MULTISPECIES: DUF732 domain-containing protein [Mycolicibacterium]|jgi:hypothetical protein|uniref:DUF732 domain-containing protein n=1 Tax=Mycolicibacterium austroafricanum TaxID=39687 RepID=A0ABT8HHW4_MYCAO|nr:MULTISPECIES: DUF732 domain-containing protein [Mycolicibacterium]MDN4520358.1 DUF732 domain-containing protein [Mycolicibacterium austroafricanum]MDW5611482.1 DUF732 domain-containing protein [Mycolicibacterium sp. D5.8-2]QRZ07759.1 DUF732 domain-containing protein [Mycolicibacterium austroafricanum]QZT69422.1 DUF732 domain-containing protein [Mycolicibacterium austroafricanum]
MLLRTALSRIVVGAAAASATAVGLASTSSGAPLDQLFLERLTNIGITYSNPYAAIVYAQGVCRQLSFGTPHSRVVDMALSDYPSFGWDGAADFVVTANMTYCPKFQ